MAIGLNRVGQLLNPGNYLNGAVDCFVDSADNTAYVVSKDDNALVIIDITNKTSPSKLGQIFGGGNYLTFARGVTFVVGGNYVYVVSKDDNSFVIIDVSSKTSPTRVGQITTLNQPSDVKVRGDYAYVTDNGSDSLLIIDISNKTSPSQVGSISGSGNYCASPRGLDVSEDGNYAYVTSDTQNSLAIINCSNKTSPVLSGEIHTSAGQYLDGARDVIAKTTYAYVVAYDSNTFSIINISNKTSPSKTGSITGSGNWLSGCIGIDIDDDEKYAIISALTQDSVTVIDIGTKNSPIFATKLSGAGEYLDGAQSADIDGWYIYATGSISDSFVVIQFTPDAPIAPTNISCIAGYNKNTISWDESIITDYYNLYWMKYEFFADEFTSLDLWDQYKDVGTETIEINSDKLRFSNSSGTGCHVVNKNEIPSGDFDIEIELVTYTPDDNSNGHKAILKTIDVYPYTNVDGAEIYYYVSGAGSTYNIVSNIYINSVLNNVSTTIAGQPSKLRITRVGNIITTYYYISSWISVDNQDFSSRSSNVIIATLDSLQTSGNGGLTEFDNFNYYVDVKTLGTKIPAIDALLYEHTLLDAEENYIYVITSENPGGESSSSEIVNGIPLTAFPDTPVLSGEGDDSQNILTITNIIGATSFDIYYSLVSGVTKTNGIKIEDVPNPYYHIDLTRQNYYYIVISNNISGESNPSNEVCVKPDFEGKIFNHTEQIEQSLLYQYKNRD